MTRFLLLFVFTLVGTVPTVFAQDLFRTVFDVPEPVAALPWTATSAQPAGSTFSGWELGPGIIPVTGQFDHAMGLGVAGGSVPRDLAGAIAAESYLRAVLDPAGGTLDWGGQRVHFGFQRASWHSPAQFAVFTSRDGFAEADALFVSEAVGQGDYSDRAFSFLLPLVGFDGLTDPLEIRIVPFGGSYGESHPLAFTAFAVTATAAVHPVGVIAEEGGTAQVAPFGTLFEQGDTVRFLAQPEPGFRFAGWSGEGIAPGERRNPYHHVVAAPVTATAHFIENAPVAMEVGQNLGGVVDWATDVPFVDMMNYARAWLTREVGDSSTWDSQETPPTDADGWPTQVPFDPGDGSAHYVHTILPTHGSGDYTLMFEGKGSFRLRLPDGTNASFSGTGGRSTHSVPVTVSSRDDWIFLELYQSDASDPIRNLHVVLPGFADTFETQPFHPEWLKALRPFPVIRFMDWGITNASPLTSWDQRTTPTSYSQARWAGVAVEYMIDLANTQRAHPWICVPHRADDDYVRQLARLVRDRLDPGLRLYLEYSNETWNTAGPFTQSTWVQDQGEALGLDPDRWVAGQYYAARRSAEVWAIFEEEFGDTAPDRLVKVLGAFAAYAANTEMRFAALNDPQISPTGVMPDAIAIAPYFGINYGLTDLPPDTAAYPTVDAILDTIAPAEITAAAGYTRAHKAIADRMGTRLICYEGGQHFLGIFGAENDLTLMSILQAANRDPRMGERYREYLTALQAEGVDLFANFSFIGAWSKWGSWSALEYQGQPLNEAPRHAALLDWQNGVVAPLPESTWRPQIEAAETGDALRLRWPTRPDHRYRLEVSPDLETWTPLWPAEQIGAGTWSEQALSIPSGPPANFWRVCDSNR